MAIYLYPPSQTTIIGGATEAKQDVIITELQQIEADIEASNVLLGTIDADTSNISAKVDTIDADTSNISTKIDTIAGAVSGTEMQVDVVSSALPSGAATEAKQDSAITELQQIEADVEASNVLLGTIDADTSNISAKVDLLEARIAGSLVPETHDYIDLAYVGATTDIQTVTYKTGGSGGATVATLTLAYDGSNRLTSVTRS